MISAQEEWQDTGTGALLEALFRQRPSAKPKNKIKKITGCALTHRVCALTFTHTRKHTCSLPHSHTCTHFLSHTHTLTHLCLCVCACGCMHACVHEYICACASACVRVFVRACVRACVRVCVRAGVHNVNETQILVFRIFRLYAYTYLAFGLYVYTYLSNYLFISIHTYIHILCMNVSVRMCSEVKIASFITQTKIM